MRGVPLVVIAVVLATVAAGTGGAVPAAIDEQNGGQALAAEGSAAANGTNVSFGAQLSSFMQSSAAQASGSVETGMWVAAYENASNDSRRTLVTRRTGQLGDRIAELQAEKRALQAARKNGSISQVEYRSRLSRIVGELAALDEGIKAVDRPDAPGLNRSALRNLSERADRLAGPEISDLARSIGGPGAGPGPPDWIEPGGPGGNETGPPDDRGQGQNGQPADDGNGTAANGPDDNPGNDDNGTGGDGGQGGGPDDNPGQGQSNDGSDTADDQADEESES